MKKILLYCLIAAIPMMAYSQKQSKEAATDPAKEKNDLIALKASLVKESAALKTTVDQEQATLNALSKKLDSTNATLAQLKAADPEKYKTRAKKDEKTLQRYRDQMTQWTQNITADRAKLKDADALIKEIDDQLKQSKS
jgi:chromosome segregation ATPase